MNDNIRSVWNELERRAKALAGSQIVDLFEREPDRLARMTQNAASLSLDFSKNLVDGETLEQLIALATAAGLPAAIEAMFDGDAINVTENRAVLHTALRAGPTSTATVNGRRVAPDIARVLERMRKLVDDVRAGRWTGTAGDRITDIVNIGIGGSHLGPQLACEALRYEADAIPNVHFLANVDGGEFDRIVSPLDPASTLFIVASKSFATVETGLNAASARDWLAAQFPEQQTVARHFVAVSADSERARAFGIDDENIYPIWEWVGGRYSLWSAIGLPIALKTGMDNFEAMLAGAADIDEHFRYSPFTANLPVLLGLVGLWNNNFLGAESYAVVPYDERLRRLPDYLQQLEMESNGKHATRSNEPLSTASAPVTWGGLGTNAQHAFFQLLHQGTRFIPVDFIVALTHSGGRREHHDMLVANCFAQAAGLMTGRTTAVGSGNDLSLHKEIRGNKPSNMISMHALTPQTLGALIALYEHKTYVQSVIWNINAFDQWGVEAGKILAGDILAAFESGRISEHHDASTAALIKRYIETRKS